GHVRSYAVTWALCGLGGVAAGTAVLLTSPGLRRRAGKAPIGAESVWDALHYWVAILAKVLVTWSYVAALALGVLIGLLAAGGGCTAFASVRPRLLVPLSGAVFLLSGYGATVPIVTYFGDYTPYSVRIRNDYLLLFILLFVVYGVLLGRAVRARANRGGGGKRRAGLAAVCALAVCAVAVAGLVPPLYGLGKEMRVRAAQWDRQDASLRRQAAAGATSLPYKPLPIQGLREPLQLGAYWDWVRPCTARYYRVDTITRSSVLP
ncbi:DUF6056 family protein, partial [Streptomyces sp. NPDC002577]